MKRRDRKPRKPLIKRMCEDQRAANARESKRMEAIQPPPFVRAAMELAKKRKLRITEENQILRDADELHRRQKEPCDVTSRREAREIMNTFWREIL